jgi:hypothetical protein
MSSSISQKICKEIMCRISDSKSLQATTDELRGYHNYWLTHINKLSGNVMDVWQQACVSLMCTFPTMVSHHSVTFTDEYAIYLSAKS